MSRAGAAERGTGQAPSISVCTLAGHGSDRLEAFLRSLRAQRGAPPFELLVGGNPDEASRDALHRHFPEAQVCDTGRRLPGAARNPLVERARGELLLFLDDDVVVPPDLLAALWATAARHPEASVFGGPNTTPPDSSRFQIVQGAVLSSLMGAGPISRRYGPREGGFADERWFTLCNLAVRRPAMVPFVSELVCAEENALLAELRTRHETMRYEPELAVFHARRPTAGSFARQIFKYGRGRGQLVARAPQTLRLPYLVPSLLLCYLVLVPVLLAAAPATLVLALPALYAGLTLATALRIGWVLRSAIAVPLAAGLTWLVHAAYGIGVIRGLLRRPRERREEPGVVWAAPAMRSGQTP